MRSGERMKVVTNTAFVKSERSERFNRSGDLITGGGDGVVHSRGRQRTWQRFQAVR